MMATILSHAYKGALLSSLTTLRYTVPLDTIDQMVESGLPLYVPRGTIHEWLLTTDPTEGAMQLNKRRIFIPFSGDFEEMDMKMYNYNSFKLQKTTSPFVYFRVDKGDAMIYSAVNMKTKYKNRQHFSKEWLGALYSSPIVTQGSPLLVG